MSQDQELSQVDFSHKLALEKERQQSNVSYGLASEDAKYVHHNNVGISSDSDAMMETETKSRSHKVEKFVDVYFSSLIFLCVSVGLAGSWRFTRTDPLDTKASWTTYTVWKDKEVESNHLHAAQFFMVAAIIIQGISLGWGLLRDRFGKARMLLPALGAFFQAFAFALYTHEVQIPMDEAGHQEGYGIGYGFNLIGIIAALGFAVMMMP